jgi:hypothetical protein
MHAYVPACVYADAFVRIHVHAHAQASAQSLQLIMHIYDIMIMSLYMCKLS